VYCAFATAIIGDRMMVTHPRKRVAFPNDIQRLGELVLVAEEKKYVPSRRSTIPTHGNTKGIEDIRP
jgi:hypothetical protein